MKRLSLFILTFVSVITTAQAAGPTNLFGQETAAVIDSGTFQLDLMGSGNSHLRMGAFGGETILNISNSTAQYKIDTSKNLALHGGLGINTPVAGNSTTTLIVGAAYTMKQDQFILNANPVLSNSAGNTIINLGLGAFMPFKAESFQGKLMGGLVLNLPVSPGGNSSFLLGLRWDAKPGLSLEAGLYNSASGLQFPGLLRINYTL
ncbi:MAG: hypothetical protein HUJ29_10170 [Gammaproteobacteria bacterium]|nr:hypothetical protein [Gammaproteobacteria bacterium]